MTEQPLVSVIMNCFNGEKYLREAIDSVYAQTYQNWEIIFWDNASKDSSANIAHSFDTKLKYFSSETLLPLYTARNRALEKCSGEVIAFLDSDDIWVPTKLERQIAAFDQENPIVYGGYKIIDETGSVGKEVIDIALADDATNELLRMNPVSIGCVLIDANVIKKYKFDSNYDLLGDFDLWIRLSLVYPIITVGGVLEFSRQHSTNTSFTLKNKWLVERRYFVRKMFRSMPMCNYMSLLRYALLTEIKGGLGNV